MTDQILSIRKTGAAGHDELTKIIDLAFDRALSRQSHVSASILKMSGMSGILYRMFINNVVRFAPNPRYLEIGSYAGSTVCSAMDKNVCKVCCIDNWSEFGGPKDQFLQNTNQYRTADIDFMFIENDFRQVDVSAIGKFNIYLFDGPHEKRDQYDGLALYTDALDEDVIFIIDDWNWPLVRSGTMEAIRDTGFRVDYAIDVRSSSNDEHAAVHGAAGDWHNGYFLSKLSRR